MISQHEAATVIAVEDLSALAVNDFDAVETLVYQSIVRESVNFRIDFGIDSYPLFTIEAKTEAGRAFMTRHFGQSKESVELYKTFSAACASTMRLEGCL